MYVGTIDRRSGDVTEVMVADERDVAHPRTILAARGNLATDDEARMARLRLYHGTILSEYTDSTKLRPHGVRGVRAQRQLRRRVGRAPRELPGRAPPHGLANAARFPGPSCRNDGSKATALELEIQRRVAVPFACVLLPWLGIALGVKQSRSVRSRGVARRAADHSRLLFSRHRGHDARTPGRAGSTGGAVGTECRCCSSSRSLAFRRATGRPAKRARP